MTRADDLDELLGDLEIHDDLIARRGLELWIGGEPTFTRADATAPAWWSAAEGDDKLARAHALAAHLARATPGATLTRVPGRRYPGEDADRFCWSVRWPRVGAYDDAAVAAVDAEITTPPAAGPLADEAWLTVTPDPGVVEVNMAPCATMVELAAQAQDIWAAAAAAGLAPERARYNGDVTDSGGGGQLTFGASTPAASPFVRYAHALPNLVRYVNNHPALSYWFAGDCVGSASQAPRPDEGVRERYDELAVALAWCDALAARGELPPDRLWEALAPLLVDAAGNSHRAELNVEKLWNPHLEPHGPRHGRLGVVELRALRMPARPAQLVAAAALWRALVARCIVDDYRAPLVDWGADLHDRFALPAALHADLQYVLGDLDDHQLGLSGGLRAALTSWRPPGVRCRLGTATLTIERALEFWPLLGDVASQERSSARWVDASTERWQLSLSDPDADDVDVRVAGRRVRLAPLPHDPASRVIGVRRRAFAPSPGLHPGLPAVDPLVIEWAVGNQAQRVELWSWRPAGGGYPGLPVDAHDAHRRRRERVVVTPGAGPLPPAPWHAQAAPYTLDLRRGAG